MREIKFRAWDNVNKCMELEIQHLDTFNEYLHKDKYDVMQYTGLKDKNGKEIYEGDILSGYPHGSSIVKWDNEYGCWHSGFDLIGNEIKDMPEREVIGNSYENPELLNK